MHTDHNHLISFEKGIGAACATINVKGDLYTTSSNILEIGDQSPEWQTPIMTKILVMTKLVFKFGRKYIYHRYIYISRPPRRGTGRQTDVQIAN